VCPRMSWTGRLAKLYDALTAPLERRALGRWRKCAWAAVPARGLGLEVGAGTGANFPHYPSAARVIATDISWEMLREASRKQADGPTALVVADVSALPFRGEAFDWAAETLVFCEVPDPLAGLAEIRRVLRPGSPVVMLEHVRPAGWLGRLADLVTALTGPLCGEHLNRETAQSVQAVGLVLERQEWLWHDLIVLLVAGVERRSAVG
jgi:ubiquinone/menaquinone biosynthesis C-methylase UbiE